MAAEEVAQFASLLADRSRAAICLVLLDGRAWTAIELARHAGIAPSTTSEHLSRMVEAGLLTEVRQGRHRYLRLASPEVADLLEQVARLTGALERFPQSMRGMRTRAGLSTARTCYDHLAGRLGVAIFAAMTRRGLLLDQDGLALTSAGRQWFAELGCDLGTSTTQRPLVRSCLDWTERRPHLAGVTGAVLHQQLLARSWISRATGTRVIKVTADGEDALRDVLGLDAAGLGAGRAVQDHGADTRS